MNVTGSTTESPLPVILRCEHCSEVGVTRTTLSNGCFVWGATGFLCCVGAACFSVLPFFVKQMKDVTHWCAQCGNVICHVKKFRR